MIEQNHRAAHVQDRPSALVETQLAAQDAVTVFPQFRCSNSAS